MTLQRLELKSSFGYINNKNLWDIMDSSVLSLRSAIFASICFFLLFLLIGILLLSSLYRGNSWPKIAQLINLYLFMTFLIVIKSVTVIIKLRFRITKLMTSHLMLDQCNKSNEKTWQANSRDCGMIQGKKELGITPNQTD